MVPSDIYLVAEQREHAQYIRAGHDLVLMLELTLTEHLTGCTKFIRHLEAHPTGNGYKMLKVNIPPLKRKLVVVGKGMPKPSIVDGNSAV